MSEARPAVRRRRLNAALSGAGVVGDVLALNTALVLAYWIRFRSGWLAVPKGEPLTREAYFGAMFAVTVVWLLVFNGLGLYRPQPWSGALDEAYRVLIAACVVLVTVLAASFLYRSFEYSRLTAGIAFVIAVAMVITLRTTGLKAAAAVRRRPGFRSRVAVLGAAAVREAVGDDREIVLDLAEAADGLARVRAAVTAGQVDEVILSRGRLSGDELIALFRDCEAAGAAAIVAPDPVDLLLARGAREDVAGLPLVRVRDVPLDGLQRAVKRLADVVAALVLLVLASLPWLVLAALIRRGSPGGALLRQTRVTEGGRTFTVYKFRSMVADAEAGTGAVWTQRGDPRVTPVGRFLRRTSLDELPQLLNILRGEMSLIGPRPERPEFVAQFTAQIPRYNDRHRMKAGLTGWAQVNGERGSDSTIERRTRFDLFYVDNWSLMLDLQILVKTAFEVFFHRGAY
jgi:exopolysaccharide biosynthesis polyprenyl glycosylphosphotransferase